MKKRFAALCALLLLLFPAAGCQQEPAGKAEAEPEQSMKEKPEEKEPEAPQEEAWEELAQELEENIGEIMEKERRIEDIFMGAGLAADPNAPYDPDENWQCFVPVADEKIDTIQKLKDKTQEVFTAQYAQKQFYQNALEGSYPRYREQDGKLYIDIGVGGALDKEWAPDSLKVLDGDETGVTATVDYMNYDSLRRSQIRFVKTPDGLRIDAMEDVGL